MEIDDMVIDSLPSDNAMISEDDMMGDMLVPINGNALDVDEYGDVVEYELGEYPESLGDPGYMYDSFMEPETGALFRKRRKRRRRGPQKARRVAKPGMFMMANQAVARKRAIAKRGGIPNSAGIKFIDIAGGKVINADIMGGAKYGVNERAFHIQSAFEDRPYKTFIKTLTPTAGVITMTASAPDVYGVGATLVKVPFFFFRLASNALNAINNRPYSFVFTLHDTLGGALSDVGTVDILAQGKGPVNINMCITPWTLIASKPRSALCALTATPAEFSIVVSGVTDDDYTATLLVPGVNHSSVNKFLRKMVQGR